MLACLITIGSAVAASGQAVIEPANAGATSEQTPAWKQFCELSLREYQLVSPMNPDRIRTESSSRAACSSSVERQIQKCCLPSKPRSRSSQAAARFIVSRPAEKTFSRK